MLVYILYIIVSLIVLYFGANFLVKGAASVAERLGVSSLVVGLTVVAFGTSTPELIVSVQATMEGFGGISIGNVIGSNIANIGLILGLSALIFPLRAHMQLIRIDTPFMILVSFLFIVFFLDHKIGRVEGLVFVIMIAAYSVYNIIKCIGCAVLRTWPGCADIRLGSPGEECSGTCQGAWYERSGDRPDHRGIGDQHA